MEKKDDIELETSPSQIEALIGRFERNELTPDDRTLNVRLLRLVLTLVSILQKKNASISKLKRMLFGPSTDRRATPPAASPSSQAPEPEAEPAPPPAAPKPPRQGHGRLGASAYPGAERVEVPHPELHAGDRCPDGCDGKLFEMGEPAILLRRYGQAPITALRFERARLRCSSCQAVFTAPLPDGVEETRFDPSADAVIAIARYQLGVPWHRSAAFQLLTGVPLPESVQFERCEVLANRVAPVFRQLEREAANCDVVHADDTPVRILSLRKEIAGEQAQKRSGRQRTGIHTSAIVAKPGAPAVGPRIALFVSSRKHAGENSAALLAERDGGRERVIRAGDRAPANRVGEVDAVEVGCWAHARRNFVEIERSFPEECAHVLDHIRELYATDAGAKKMTPSERLALHQEQSGPVLERLRAWIEAGLAERAIEPNSSLGAAVQYLLNAWTQLTEVLRTPGVPLDNNEAERIVKVVARQRKNSLFYATVAGAGIGDVLQSVMTTCVLNGVDPLAYLTAVGRTPDAVRSDPEGWAPWRWAARASPSTAGRVA